MQQGCMQHNLHMLTAVNHVSFTAIVGDHVYESTSHWSYVRHDHANEHYVCISL